MHLPSLTFCNCFSFCLASYPLLSLSLASSTNDQDDANRSTGQNRQYDNETPHLPPILLLRSCKCNKQQRTLPSVSGSKFGNLVWDQDEGSQRVNSKSQPLLLHAPANAMIKYEMVWVGRVSEIKLKKVTQIIANNKYCGNSRVLTFTPPLA